MRSGLGFFRPAAIGSTGAAATFCAKLTEFTPDHFERWFNLGVAQEAGEILQDNEGLKAIGATRQMFNIHNAICCRPPRCSHQPIGLRRSGHDSVIDATPESMLNSMRVIGCCSDISRSFFTGWRLC